MTSFRLSEVPARVAHRVATKVQEESDGCLISLYSTGSHGYAQIGWHENGERIVTLAHRVAWIAANGEIPAGMTVDHTCKRRQCVNVDHLRLLENYENARRTSGRDWPLGECANGHPNKHLKKVDGGRRTKCSLCMADWQRAYRARKRAARAAA